MRRETSNNARHCMDQFHRYCMILKTLPRLPEKRTVSQIMDIIVSAGCTEVSRRTIERDLEKLSGPFQIADDGHKPAGWAWKREAAIFTFPGMDPHTALSFRLVDKFMKQLFPRTCLEYLKPHIDTAEKVFEELAPANLQQWHEKVRILPKGQHLLPAQVKTEVLDEVYKGLLTEKRIVGNYRKRGETELRQIEISPLGLVFEDGVICLVGPMWDYDNPVQVLLHRFEDAKVIDKPVKVPEGFTLEGYLRSEERNFPIQDGEIRFVGLFDKSGGHHLQETPLSEDQVVSEEADGRLRVTATVRDTSSLRWWILGFGDLVEVVEPESLREEISQVAQRMARKYGAKGGLKK